MLVVIAIISILAAMLLPALAKAKEKGKRVQCLNNVKQLQLAYHLYVGDYNDSLPPNLFTPLASLPGSWVLGNAKTDADPAMLEGGVLFPQHRSRALYHCPSDLSRTVSDASLPGGLPRNRSYSIDVAMGASEDSARRLSKGSEILSPAPVQKSVFWEEDPRSIDNGGFGIRPEGMSVWWNLPASRHSLSCTVSFFDGHAETWKWRGTSVLAPGAGDPGLGNAMNFPAPANDPDLARVQATTLPAAPAPPL
jgi:prepilin-type processing-associated H-X9-DG protein